MFLGKLWEWACVALRTMVARNANKNVCTDFKRKEKNKKNPMGSIYTNTPYTNTPYTNVTRDASYPYGFPYLSSQLPQTHYPWDSVYDSRYQRDIQNPKYRWYGSILIS